MPLACILILCAYAAAATRAFADPAVDGAAQFAAMRWRNIGPAGSGGRVAAVAGSDRDPSLYYFGAAGGGVFKTSNAGLTWLDVWPKSSVGAIGAVAVAASNQNVVWAGTGESKPRNDASYGDGVWVTRDGARTWTHAGLRGTYAISRILVDPRDPNIALAAALGNPFVDSSERGVYRTSDGGRTWRKTLYTAPDTGASDLAWSPRQPDVVYAGLWQFRRQPWMLTSGGSRSGLYKSTDGGRTWKRLTGNGLPAAPAGRIGLAVSASQPDRVYALIQSREGVLWRSDTGARTWRRMSRDSLINQRPFYMSRLDVDPSDPDRVIFASENLIQTRDGGKTYSEIKQAVHQDHHGTWISQDGRRLIEASDGAAEISIDRGKTWDWRFNVAIGQIYHVSLDDENPYHVCGGLQDNDNFCGPSQSLSKLGILNSDWRIVGNDGDGIWAWPQPGRPSSIWNVGINQVNGQLGIFDLASRQNVDISPDVTDTSGKNLRDLPYRFNWEAAFAFSRIQAGVAYFGGNVVFATANRGVTWKVISPDLTRNDRSKQVVSGGPINTDASGAEFYGTILDIAPSPIDAKVMWVGTDDGLVQRTADGGEHWDDVTPRFIAPWGRVETVEPSSISADRAYAVINRHLSGDPQPYIVATGDAGHSWHAIVNGLPAGQFAHVVREDPRNSNVLYAGLEEGVWVSLDRGEHWQSLRNGMPPVAIHDLRVEPVSHDLVAATHGRGFWILDDLTPIASASEAPALFPVRPAYTWFMAQTTDYGTHSDECCVVAGAYSGENPGEGALISYRLSVPSARPIAIDVLQGETVIRRLHAPGHAGLNRIAWDLTIDPAVAWRSAPEWNRGGDAGPVVVPGTYSVRLHAAGTTVDRTVDVRPDPRATWTQAEYVQRFEFLKGLDDELSQLDVALNRLDTMRKSAGPALRAHIDTATALITQNPRNSEDSFTQNQADRVRERIAILQGVVALSQGPPLAPHVREREAIEAEFASAMDAYRALLHQNGLSEK